MYVRMYVGVCVCVCVCVLMGVSSCTLCVGESVGAGYFSRSSLGAVCGGSHVCWYCVHPPLLTGRLRTRC